MNPLSNLTTMSTDVRPNSPRGRLRRAFDERLVIADSLLFRQVIGVMLAGLLTLFGLVSQVVRVEPLHLLVDGFRRTTFRWPVFSAVAVATTGLYVVVRGGTLLVDYSRRTAN